PRVQGRGRPAGHREGLLGGGGGPVAGPPRDPAPLLEAGPPGPGRPGLPRPRQAQPPGGRGPPPQGREPPPPDGASHLKKSDGLLRQGGSVIFPFIEAHKDVWPVPLMCETLYVSTNGFSAWRDRPASPAQLRRAAILVEVRAIHAEVKQRYGSPR